MSTTVLLVPVHHEHRDTAVRTCHMEHTKHMYLGICCSALVVEGTTDHQNTRNCAPNSTVSHRRTFYSAISYSILPDMNTARLQNINHISVVWGWTGGRGAKPHI